MSLQANAVRQAAAPVAPNVPWTCPFCPLLCDGFRVDSLAPPRLAGSDCAVALRGLAAQAVPGAEPRVNGAVATHADAVRAAAALLKGARQPLFGGLATDVAGARALYALAERTGAICDAASGRAMLHGQRATQDRGVFTTTLAEVRERADLIVCVTGSPLARYPELGRRCGDKPLVELPVEADADLFTTVSRLAALVAAKRVDAASPALRSLAERLRSARYSVLAWDAAALPPHGALIVETINRVVATLNTTTRSALLPLGGGDGASTVSQVFTWLSGLPLRSRAGARGLEHEPLRFDASRLLADGDVDALLWVAAFGPEPAPPDTSVPMIVIGHSSVAVPANAAVFIPVSTCGIGAAVGSSRVDLQACKLEYSIVSPK